MSHFAHSVSRFTIALALAFGVSPLGWAAALSQSCYEMGGGKSFIVRAIGLPRYQVLEPDGSLHAPSDSDLRWFSAQSAFLKSNCPTKDRSAGVSGSDFDPKETTAPPALGNSRLIQQQIQKGFAAGAAAATNAPESLAPVGDSPSDASQQPPSDAPPPPSQSPDKSANTQPPKQDPELQRELAASEKRKGADEALANAAGRDEKCAHANAISGGKISCRGADGLITTSKVTEAVAMIGGSSYVNYQGGKAQQQLMETGAKQSEALKASADLQDNAGKQQQVIGTFSTLMGAAQLLKGRGLNKGGDKLAKGQLANQTYNGGKFNAQGVDESGFTRQEYGTGAGEARTVASRLNTSGLQTLVRGAQTFWQGKINRDGAKSLRKAANALANVEDKFKDAKPPGFDPFAPPGSGARSPNTIGGNGLNPNSKAAAGEDESTGDGAPIADLGPGTNPDLANDSLVNPAPAPGERVRGGGPEGNSGGPAGLSGVSTNPNSGGGDSEPQPQYADNSGTEAGYRNEESARAGRGGGPGTGGAGAGDVDLGKLLAQFLPKDDEKAGNENGILDFGGRAPAAEPDDSASLLDRSVNIFERVSQAYQHKAKQGKIGI